jgi:hypothetical protein
MQRPTMRLKARQARPILYWLGGAARFLRARISNQSRLKRLNSATDLERDVSPIKKPGYFGGVANRIAHGGCILLGSLQPVIGTCPIIQALGVSVGERASTVRLKSRGLNASMSRSRSSKRRMIDRLYRLKHDAPFVPFGVLTKSSRRYSINRPQDLGLPPDR